MRIDIFLCKKGYAKSRTAAQAFLKEGLVTIDGKIIDKPSFEIDENAEYEISVTKKNEYVSRGALKLEGALNEFGIDVKDFVCVDIGASNGGFTDVLLQKGAKKVYAVDVGYDQLDEKLRNDQRVVSIEKFNARFLSKETLGQECDIAVMDVSFISQKLLFDNVYSVLKDGGIFISLIKPQFETGIENRKKYISKNGIVKNPLHHIEIINSVITEASKKGLFVKAICPSLIHGGDGNIEFLALYYKNAKSFMNSDEVRKAVEAAHKKEKQ